VPNAAMRVWQRPLLRHQQRDLDAVAAALHAATGGAEGPVG